MYWTNTIGVVWTQDWEGVDSRGYKRFFDIIRDFTSPSFMLGMGKREASIVLMPKIPLLKPWFMMSAEWFLAFSVSPNIQEIRNMIFRIGLIRFWTKFFWNNFFVSKSRWLENEPVRSLLVHLTSTTIQFIVSDSLFTSHTPRTTLSVT